MATGPKLSGSIDAGLEDLRAEEAALAEQLKAAVEALKAYRTEQAGAYRDLAAMRLSAIAGGELVKSLDGAERRAAELLAQSGKARAALEAELERSRERLAEAESAVDAQGEKVVAAERALDAGEAALQAKLAKDPAYREQAGATDEAVRIADEADRKTVLAEEDRSEKGKPYEADPLFMYLRKRGFGTSQYRSWGIVKALDQWVARLVGYQTARANYAMLLEIPERLRAHTERVHKAAEAAVEALAALEEKARDDDGVTALEKALERQRGERTDLDKERATIAETLSEQEKALATFDRGEDEHTAQALQLLADELRRDTLRRLQHEALLTPDPRDDELVGRIDALEDAIDEAQEDVSMRQESLQVLAERRAELEQVRTEFRDKRYHTNDWQFDDYGALEALLQGLLRGAISGSQYWRELQRNSRRSRKRRAKIDFGSRGYRPSGTSWTRTSRPSSGGFRTGGGFGRSSGFKTGGRF